MIKKSILFFMVLLSLPTFAKIGSNRDYMIISQSEYNERTGKGENIHFRRCIVVPDYNENYKEIHEVDDQNLLLSTFSFMLKENKKREMKQYITQCDTLLEINSLLCGLYYFSQKEYNKALYYIEKYDNIEYSFLKHLLIADIKYELLDDKSNYKSVLSLYQEAYDISDKEQNKVIIKNRIKYIRYRS